MKIFRVGSLFNVFIYMFSLYCVYVRRRNSPNLQGCSMSCDNDIEFNRVQIRSRQI